MCFLKAAKSYNVPNSTLIDYVKKVNTGETLENLLNKSLGQQSILTPKVDK